MATADTDIQTTKNESTFDLFASKKDKDGITDSFLCKLLRRDDTEQEESGEEMKGGAGKQEEEGPVEQVQQAISQVEKKPSEGAWAGLGQIVTHLLSSAKSNESDDDDDDDDDNNNDNKTDSIEAMVQKARAYAETGEFLETKSIKDLDHLRWELDQVMSQLQKSFDHVGLDKINILAFLYYLEQEESIKTPSWKRRKHRFLPSLDLSTVQASHDALYLAELAYVDTIEDIRAGLAAFRGAPHELIYCTVESLPREPAHFVALRKDSSQPNDQGFRFPWDKSSGKRLLEVLMVVRGTKEVGDMLSDALLEASDYRGGKAHNGIAEAGRFLVEKHTALLEHLLEESDYNKIRLSLIGHSLGAGAAAIAAIEFNDHPDIEATCVGFGCPATLNKELAEQTKDYITTVVSDSDVVPRMSGETVANMLLDAMSLDFTEKCVADISELLLVAKGNVPFPIPDEKIREVSQWAKSEIERNVKETLESISKERSEPVLFPPGKCIHLYRDGVGISACYVTCDFFDSIDMSRTMVEDHYIATGYHRLFLELMRDHYKDSTFEFRHDVAGLRIEKDKRSISEEET